MFQCGAYLKGMAELEKSKPVSIFCYFFPENQFKLSVNLSETFSWI